MPAPTLVTSGSSAYDSSATPKTASVALQTGDILVVKCGFESYGGGLGNFTVTLTVAGAPPANRQTVAVTDYAYARVDTYEATADGSVTISLGYSNSGGAPKGGFTYDVWRSHGGVGTSNKANASGAPSLTLTGVAANSALSVANYDWNVVNPSPRTMRTTGVGAGTEEAVGRDAAAAAYTWYTHYHPDAGASGSKTVGWSAPSGQKYSIVALEVLGTAGGGAQTLAGSAAGAATPAGALSITAQLVAASLAISTPAGTLSVALNPAGAVLGAAVVAGALALEVPLAASAQAVAQTAGALGVVKPLAGVSAGLAAINGTLSVSSGAALDGAAAGAAQVVGALDLLKPLSGNSLGAAAVAGGLSLAIAFNGAALGQAFVQGALQIEGAVDLAGAAQGATTVQGAIDKLAALSAAAGGEADARATLALTLNLSGTAGGQAAGAGTLLVQGGISGAVLVEAIASGTLTMAVNLSGAALAQALIAGSLADMQSFTISPRHVVRAPRRDWTAGARGREWRVAA